MATNRIVSPGRNARSERGDPSEKAMKATIVVCLIGLAALYLFSLAPKKGASPIAASSPLQVPQAKEAVATFDRQSLSTKNR